LTNVVNQLDLNEPSESATAGTSRRTGRRIAGRFLRHEWTLAATFSVVLSVLMTWPTLRDPMHVLPGDTWDPSFQSWELAWTGWAVKHDPSQLWQSNAFLGDHYGFAYSDTLLGYLPATLIGSGPQAAVLRYNILFELVFALAFFGAYVLARQLGSGIAGSAVAGAAFAYAPWRWTQIFHLHVLSTGGLALALAMLARGHGYSLRYGYRPQLTRPGWALAGWLVAAWQVTIGFGTGIPFGYVLGVLALLSFGYWLVRRPRFDKRLLRMDLVGALVFLVVSALMAYPYLKMLEIYPYAPRTLVDVMYYSPPIQGFFIGPPTDWLWGSAESGIRVSLDDHGGWEAILLPGFTLYALALVGLFVSVWSWRRRVLLAVGLVAVGTLAEGMRAPISLPYRLAFRLAPGWDAIRTPGRLIIWVTLILALLAAGAITMVGEMVGPWLRQRRAVLRRSLLTVGGRAAVRTGAGRGDPASRFSDRTGAAGGAGQPGRPDPGPTVGLDGRRADAVVVDGELRAASQRLKRLHPRRPGQDARGHPRLPG